MLANKAADSEHSASAVEAVDPRTWAAPTGTICCGHPNRHVVRTSLASAAGPVEVFIKTEHRRRFQDRLKNFLAGFGWCSPSLREYHALIRAREHGIGCPKPIAAGDTPDGKSHLVVHRIEGALPLAHTLRDVRQRRKIMELLGYELARLHACGIIHGDLYAKHVLIDIDRRRVYFLDWQRARFRRRLSLAERSVDLAALHATLHDELASQRLRMRLLIRYAQTSRKMGAPVGSLRRFANRIDRRARRMLKRSRIGRLRAQSLGTVEFGEELIWIDGERLAVTPAFLAETGGVIPSDLRSVYSMNRAGRQRLNGIPGAVLIRHRLKGPFARLRAWMTRRSFVAREVELARTIQHLRRHGVGTPQLLAVGQRRGFMRVEGFVLWREPSGSRPFNEALNLWDRTEQRERRIQRIHLARRLAVAMRWLHSGGYRLADVGVLIADREDWAVCLVPVTGRPPRRRLGRSAIVRDLETAAVRLRLSSRRECVELLRSYFGEAMDRPIVRKTWRRLAAIVDAAGRSDK